MPFSIKELEIPGLILIEPQVFGDERGFFMETYRMPDFAAAGINGNFVQGPAARSGNAEVPVVIVTPGVGDERVAETPVVGDVPSFSITTGKVSVSPGSAGRRSTR